MKIVITIFPWSDADSEWGIVLYDFQNGVHIYEMCTDKAPENIRWTRTFTQLKPLTSVIGNCMWLRNHQEELIHRMNLVTGEDVPFPCTDETMRFVGSRLLATPTQLWYIPDGSTHPLPPLDLRNIQSIIEEVKEGVLYFHCGHWRYDGSTGEWGAYERETNVYIFNHEEWKLTPNNVGLLKFHRKGDEDEWCVLNGFSQERFGVAAGNKMLWFCGGTFQLVDIGRKRPTVIADLVDFPHSGPFVRKRLRNQIPGFGWFVDFGGGPFVWLSPNLESWESYPSRPATHLKDEKLYVFWYENQQIKSKCLSPM